ncbi:divergent polysaccharide deacetylase family protein [Novispirillum sp. DQ9]|uniref:divergent polysaccharide deacetylase family protein n=1 Tax=Novispirillum sp. DQ9 TaxID=3398612 RepID=UPI003C7BF3BE
MASPKGKAPRKTSTASTAKPRKRPAAKPQGGSKGGGGTRRGGKTAAGRGLRSWLRGTPGVALVALGLLTLGLLGGWGLGMLREAMDGPAAPLEAASPPPPGSKPLASVPEPPRPPAVKTERGYTEVELDALERALKAAQDAAEYRDGSLYMPNTPPVTTPARLPLWDPKAADERATPAPSARSRPEPEPERQVAALPVVPPPATTPPPAPAPAPASTPAAAAKPVPRADRVETTPKLAVPASFPKAPPGAPEWLTNAVAPPPINGRPMIAIVIDDMGVDRKRTKQVVALPGPLTASFLTYAPDLRAQAQAARAAGKELMVHMPMEPDNPAIDAGPGVLKTSMDPQTIRARFIAGLDSFGGYVGVNNHMGSRFTADAAGMRPVIEALRERGLFWLDSRTTGKPAGPGIASALKVPYIERNIFLDHFNNVEGVRAQLVQLEAAARSHGYAIGIGHPKDHTIKALAEWLPTLEAKGLVLVPASAVVRLRHPEG